MPLKIRSMAYQVRVKKSICVEVTTLPRRGVGPGDSLENIYSKSDHDARLCLESNLESVF